MQEKSNLGNEAAIGCFFLFTHLLPLNHNFDGLQ